MILRPPAACLPAAGTEAAACLPVAARTGRSALAALVLAGMLAGCSHGGDHSQAVSGDSTSLATPTQENHLMGEDKSATAGDQTAVGVNAYLWRGAIDTLSFMPFASAEPEGGIIITDWYAPPTTSGERFKANAYILGKQLRSDAIRVSIFRQVMQGGQWVDQPVAPNTAADITSKILARARQLRADAGGAG